MIAFEKAYILTVFLLAIFAGHSYAQEDREVDLHFVDPFGHPITGAELRLTTIDQELTIHTDKRGIASKVRLKAGMNRIEARIVGFELFSKAFYVGSNTTRLLCPMELGKIHDPTPYRLQIRAPWASRSKGDTWVRILNLYAGRTDVTDLASDGTASFWGEFGGTYLICIFEKEKLIYKKIVSLRAVDREISLPAPEPK